MSVAEDRTTLDELCVNTIRTLSMDAVQKANSGHPGHADGARAARLRALHAGDGARAEQARLAGSRPLRAQLRARVDAPVLDAVPDGLRAHARRPQELPPARLADRRPPRVRPRRRASRPRPGRSARASRTAVGMALAERMLAERFNRDGHEIVDHYTYVIASDGDLQEGVASEASSLAGHLGLGKLISFWDDNHISIEGDTALSFTEDVAVALRGLRLARPEPRRGHRPGPHRGGAGQRPRRHRPAEHDRRPHAHRARLAEQAGHARRARRAARRRGDQAHQGGLRLPEPGALLRRRRGARALPRLHRARRRGRGGVARALRGLPRRASRPRPPSSSASSSRKLPGRLGRRRPDEDARTTA